MKTAIILSAALLLVGCDRKYQCQVYDPKERERIFFECLKNAKNSTHVKYNDSAEVVEECSYVSMRLVPTKDGLSDRPYDGQCVPLEEEQVTG
jgi:hypothetical protein